MKLRFLLPLALLASACSPPAQQAEAPPPAAAPGPLIVAGDLSIENAWAAATPGGAVNAAGYLTIVNAGSADDRLISAASPRAARVELHEMAMDGAIMTMRRVEAITAPAGGEAVLAPEGLHLMFFDIDAPFAPGETVPIQLEFEQSGAVAFEMPVRARNAASEHGH